MKQEMLIEFSYYLYLFVCNTLKSILTKKLHNVRLCIGFALFEGIAIVFFEDIEPELLEDSLFHP